MKVVGVFVRFSCATSSAENSLAVASQRLFEAG
jgi:hypothetical protein